MKKYGIGLTILVTSALLYSNAFAKSKVNDLLTQGDLRAVTQSLNHQLLPDVQILDAQGRQIDLRNLHVEGKLLMVDLWATWCGGCVAEMPTIAKLQAAYAGRIVVTPISMDLPKDREKARAFMARFPQLPFYQNESEQWPPAITTALKPKVGQFPTAIIFDRSGHEVARLTGTTADWSGRDAHAFFDRLLAQN